MRTNNWPSFRERPLWIHASSGEFEYAKAVIREIKNRRPDLPIVVTYFSPTYAKSVERFPGVDFSLPLPLDLPGPISSFLKRINPCQLLIARTDFWPELLTQARRRQIPIQVFAYTQKEKSNKPWSLSRQLARWRLELVDRVDCVTEDDLKNVEALKPKHTLATVQGDTRYDQVRYRLDHPKQLPSVLKPVRTCMVAGSTWAEDEAVLLPALRSVLQEARMQLILVPHEPTPNHIASLKKELESMGLSYSLYSEGKPWSDRAVLLVDQVGILAELYLWGDLAFVGGSFRKTVHSVMEALGASCLTYVGPLHTNNREAIEFHSLTFDGRPGVHVVRNAGEFEAKVRDDLSDMTKRQQFKEALLKDFNGRLGASSKLAKSFVTGQRTF